MYKFFAGLLGCVSSICLAQSQFDPAVAFGARPSVEHISLSPDGTKIAYIAPRSGQGSAVFYATIGGGDPRPVTSVSGDPERLGRCDWVANDRLACRVYAVLPANPPTVANRMVALDLDGGNVRQLSQLENSRQRYTTTYGGGLLDLLPGEDGSVLMDRNFVEERTIGTRLANDKSGYGVVKIDTRSLKTRTVEDPVRFGSEFLTDGHGNVRIQGVMLPASAAVIGDVVRYSYRRKNSKSWNRLSEYNVNTEEGFNPFAVDPRLDVVYGLKKLNGRHALYRIALDGSMREELVFAHREVDVDGVARIGRSRRPVGAVYTTDVRQIEYFDPELRSLASSLAKSLPNLPQIGFVDSSVDESKLLVFAQSDTDPGRYYLFDKPKKQLAEIMLVRPALEYAKLATMQSITYKASDGTSIPAYLTLPPGGAKTGLPAIVMPHGGPSARDEWGFDWLVQFYAARGYAVLQPNYRGSSGYGDAWFRNQGFQKWKVAIDDVLDAGRWMVAQGIADPKKLAAVGWSYGGYAALQSAVVDPNLFKAVVAIAPVTDLDLLKQEIGSTTWANKIIGSGPHVREGSPAQNAARINAPVLLFHGELDRNVSVTESRVMADKLRAAGKSVQYVEIPKLDHSLVDSRVRADMLRRSDAFLRSSMGM
ncbi:MAG TPA: S9 family peptidase, partial [Sphingomicrobium sp.]|nr:S9 family peptidase [Sphingomicrobium sp.]